MSSVWIVLKYYNLLYNSWTTEYDKTEHVSNKLDIVFLMGHPVYSSTKCTVKYHITISTPLIIVGMTRKCQDSLKPTFTMESYAPSLRLRRYFKRNTKVDKLYFVVLMTITQRQTNTGYKLAFQDLAEGAVYFFPFKASAFIWRQAHKFVLITVSASLYIIVFPTNCVNFKIH